MECCHLWGYKINLPQIKSARNSALHHKYPCVDDAISLLYVYIFVMKICTLWWFFHLKKICIKAEPPRNLKIHVGNVYNLVGKTITPSFCLTLVCHALCNVGISVMHYLYCHCFVWGIDEFRHAPCAVVAVTIKNPYACPPEMTMSTCAGH